MQKVNNRKIINENILARLSYYTVYNVVLKPSQPNTTVLLIVQIYINIGLHVSTLVKSSSGPLRYRSETRSSRAGVPKFLVRGTLFRNAKYSGTSLM